MPLLLVPKGVKNLAGRTDLGDLIPERIIEIVPDKGAVWECRCVCGETRNVLANVLLAGRVVACERCARAKRTAQLQAAWSRAYAAGAFRPGRQAGLDRGWREHLEAMTDGQRAEYDDMIARREKMGVAVTERVRAEAVDAVLRAA
jgi:hypothetical protein